MSEESNQAITIFIPSGAGAPGFAGILRCLQEEPRWRVLAGDMNANAYGKALADGFFLMPSSDDEVAYLSAIRKVCLEESVDVILPITPESWAYWRDIRTLWLRRAFVWL
jgi:hypothetical protein